MDLKVYFIKCPSCDYYHIVQNKLQANEIVGCPNENEHIPPKQRKKRTKTKLHNGEMVEDYDGSHRYSKEEMRKLHLAVLEAFES